MRKILLSTIGAGISFALAFSLFARAEDGGFPYMLPEDDHDYPEFKEHRYLYNPEFYYAHGLSEELREKIDADTREQNPSNDQTQFTTKNRE